MNPNAPPSPSNREDVPALITTWAEHVEGCAGCAAWIRQEGATCATGTGLRRRMVAVGLDLSPGQPGDFADADDDAPPAPRTAVAGIALAGLVGRRTP